MHHAAELREGRRLIRPSDQKAETPERVVAIVLAAGLSRRMQPWNKLLLRNADGQTVIAATVDNVLASKADSTIVVAGHQGREIEAQLAGRDLLVIHAEDHAEGLSASLRAGLVALPANVRSVLICLGDMPLVTARTLDKIIAAHKPILGHLVIVPTYGGKRGNPILWDSRFVPDLKVISGDVGGRGLLDSKANAVRCLDVNDPGVLRDLDTQSDALALRYSP